jgi:hypothetical protein
MNRFLSLGLLCCAVLLISGGMMAVPPRNDDQMLARSRPVVAKLGEHYLMLVYTAVAFQMDEARLRQLDKSSYDGIAVAFLHAYDTSDVPTVSAMDAKIAEWKKYTHKDIWPWVYLNRAVAMSTEENNPHADLPYFRRIQGMDLDDKAGALADFYRIWRNSLAAARDSKAPGVVFDFEFYNYRKLYDIRELAATTGKKPAEVAESLRKIGAQMAHIAADQYPGATIWMLMTGLTRAGHTTAAGTQYYPSPTYITIGMLEEISKLHLPLQVIGGGESSLGYCHESLLEFQQAIRNRDAQLQEPLQKYNGSFSLAGTMTMWRDRSEKQDWLNQGACKASDAATVEDLQPYLELLLKSYRYNWIYAGGGGYVPYLPSSAPRFDRVIAAAQARVYSTH